jgi:hypothetical protein
MNTRLNIFFTVLKLFIGLLIGFTFFRNKHNYQGVQNSAFACFMALVVGSFHSNMMQVPFIRFRWDISPAYLSWYDLLNLSSRQLYEDRERQSKMYHWIPLLTSCLASLVYSIDYCLMSNIVLPCIARGDTIQYRWIDYILLLLVLDCWMAK